jgi:signal transduction histidine kinase
VVYYASNPVSLMGNVLFLTVPILVVLLFNLLSRWREKEREALAEKEAQYRAYMSAVLTAQEDERKRIAQGLHDETVQTLLVIANRVQSALRHTSQEIPQELEQQLGGIRDMLLEVTNDVRGLSIDLRPSLLDNLGLVAALRRLVENLNDDAISARILLTGKARKLPAETEIVLYRFVQEAISNVRRHAEATEVFVSFRFHQDTIKIEIKDNGKGFTVPKDNMAFAAQGKFGIIGMQEKAKALRGTFNVFSERNKGVSVSLEIRTG